MAIRAWLKRLFVGAHSAPIDQTRDEPLAAQSADRVQETVFGRSQQSWAASNYDDYIYPESPEREIKIKINAWLHYKDMKGHESYRTITTNKLMDAGGKSFIHAYCHLRQGNRTFNASQILEFVDRDTGEVIPDAVLYLVGRYQQTPMGRVQKIVDEAALEVLCLVFVARADGSMRNKQKAIISRYLNELSPGLDCSEVEITEVVQGFWPSQTEYRKTLKELKVKPTEDRRRLVAALEATALTRASNNEFGKSAVAVAIKALA